MSDQTIRILILGNDWSRMNDLINFSDRLAKNNAQFDIHFLLRKRSFLDRFPKLDSYGTIISAAKEIASQGAKLNDSLITKIKSRLFGEVRNLVSKHCPKSSLAELFTYQYKHTLFKEEIRHGKELADQFDAVLCFTDIAHECGIAYLKAFQEKGTPIIAIMLLNPAAEALTMARKNNRVLEAGIKSPLTTHICKSLYKNNTLDYQGKTYLYHSPGALFALNKIKAHAKNWFIRGTSHVDIVCCDSQYDFDNNISLGVSKEKLRITGDYALDDHFLANKNKLSIRKKLCEKHNLNPENQFIILALPQMAEHGYLDWDTHFEYINNIISSCEHDNANLLISLHPKMDIEKYRYIEEKHSCSILSERLFEVLGAADTFLSKASSTIRWGVMCDINVILFDFWGFDIDSYKHLSSIDIVTKLPDLKPTIEKRLIEKQDHSKVHTLLSRNELFDGKTMKRYAKLISELPKKMKKVKMS